MLDSGQNPGKAKLVPKQAIREFSFYMNVSHGTHFAGLTDHNVLISLRPQSNSMMQINIFKWLTAPQSSTSKSELST